MTEAEDEADDAAYCALLVEAGFEAPRRYATQEEFDAERDAFWKGVFGGGPS
jgi:hypothetical protein